MDNASYLDTLAEVYLKLGDKTNAKKFNDMAKKFAEKKDPELGLALSQAQFEMRFLGIKLNSTSVPSLRVMV